ncbi:MAG: hypothetical protein ACJ79S_03610 [Gemmatimonadaceae bacterium]
MPTPAAALRLPHQRVFLPRTKLAYVHLRNLLTDAKRDRAARVSGYVAIWLAEEMVLLYLSGGELVNATTTHDGRDFAPVAIADALAKVPAEPELGEICFHEAPEEQLACMHAAQVGAQVSAQVGAAGTLLDWPAEMDPRAPESLFPYLAATTFDGAVEIASGSALNYLVFRDGSVRAGYLADGETGPLVVRVRRLFGTDVRRVPRTVRRFEGPPPLPIQAPPALIQAYRELATSLVRRLVAGGASGAPAVAEAARESLVASHPALRAFGNGEGAAGKGTAEPAGAVTDAMGAWITELLWAAASEGPEPEVLLREAALERRHVFQRAGFFDRLPWTVTW